MLTFSIVIPVYNTPVKYLEKCLNSVFTQTYSKKEIFIIDDGSTDENTLNYLKQYEPDYTVRYKLNGGQATARNMGIELAKGDYTLFLDSDDYWLSNQFLAEIAVLLQESNADMLSLSYAEFFAESEPPMFVQGTIPRERIFGQPRETALKTLLGSSRSTFSSVQHTKVMRTAFLRENNIRFLEKVNCEDAYFTANVIQKVQTIDRYDYTVYAFRRSNLDSDTAGDTRQLKIERDMITVFHTLFADKIVECELVLDFLGSPFVYWMGKAARIAATQGKGIIRDDIAKMKQYSYVMCHSSRIYIKAMGYLCKLTGIDFAIWLLRLYLRLNRKHMLSIHRKVN